MEYSLLRALVRDEGRIVTREQLLDEVWGYRYAPHLVDAHVSRLRKKLDVYGSRLIAAVRGTGYILKI